MSDSNKEEKATAAPPAAASEGSTGEAEKKPLFSFSAGGSSGFQMPTLSGDSTQTGADDADAPPPNPDIHVEPIVELQPVDVVTGEEDEEELYAVRAKMYRWGEGNAGLQWKERGTGLLRLLKSPETGLIRLVMRRDKTHKMCANHILSEEMILEENHGSDRSWVYKCYCDYAELEPSQETLAVRFKNREIAETFKEQFEKARDANLELKKGASTETAASSGDKEAKDVDQAASELSELKIEGEAKTEENDSSKGEEAKSQAEQRPETSE